MAAPVIDNVQPTSAELAPGSSVTFTVEASDADATEGSLSFVVRDGSGNLSAPVEIPLAFSDPLTLEVTPSEGLPATVTVQGMTVIVEA